MSLCGMNTDVLLEIAARLPRWSKAEMRLLMICSSLRKGRVFQQLRLRSIWHSTVHDSLGEVRLALRKLGTAKHPLQQGISRHVYYWEDRFATGVAAVEKELAEHARHNLRLCKEMDFGAGLGSEITSCADPLVYWPGARTMPCRSRAKELLPQPRSTTETAITFDYACNYAVSCAKRLVHMLRRFCSKEDSHLRLSGAPMGTLNALLTGLEKRWQPCKPLLW